MGIGTSSPSSKLEIADSTGGVAIDLNNTGTGGDSFLLMSTNDSASIGGGKFSIFNGISHRFVINSAGNVGIGNDNPVRELDITGSGNVYLRLAAKTDGDWTAIELTNTQETWTIRNNDQNNDALEFVSDAVNALTIVKDGRVGIGTDNPARIVHIADASVAAIQLENTSEADSFIDFMNPSRTFRVGYDDSTDLFKVAVTNFNDNSLVVNSSGNVGINTSPIYGNKFEILQPSNYTRLAGSGGLRVFATSATGGDGQYYGAIELSRGTGHVAISAVQTGGDSDQVGLAFFTHPSATGADAAVEAMRIDSSGNVGIGTTLLTGTRASRLVVNGGDVFAGTFSTLGETYGPNASSARGSIYEPSGTVMRIAGTSNGVNAGALINFNAYNSDNGATGAFIGGVAGPTGNGPANIVFGRRTGTASWAESMRIDSNGNVGIGANTTADSDTLLDINGGFDYTKTNIRIQASSASVRNLTIGKDSSTLAYIDHFGSNSELRLRTYTTSSFISLYTNGTERMRVLPSGGITFNGDTSTSNALDDYEEGTWTPTFGNGTTFVAVTHSNSVYTKIGNKVTVTSRIVNFNTSSFASGDNVHIGGLPYVSAPQSYGSIFLRSTVSGDVVEAINVIQSSTVFLVINTTMADINSGVTDGWFTITYFV